MGEGFVVWLAIAGGVVAAACAVASATVCAWLTRPGVERMTRGAQRTTVYMPHTGMPIHQAPTMHVPVQVPVRAQPPTFAYSPGYDQPPVAPHAIQAVPPLSAFAPAPPRPAARGPIVLEGNYPQLGTALGTWLQMEGDEVERIRIARDLGSIGDAPAARALLDGVRTGALSPTVAADQLERGGFHAGIAVAAALNDPEPRVRSVAASLVGRATPLVDTRVSMPPMPTPPSRPPG